MRKQKHSRIENCAFAKTSFRRSECEDCDECHVQDLPKTTISVGACPKCGGPAQFIKGGKVRYIQVVPDIAPTPYECDAKILLDAKVLNYLRSQQRKGRASIRAGEVARKCGIDSVKALGAMERVKRLL